MRSLSDFGKSYNELMSLHTYDDRLSYLRTFGKVGEDRFGFDRYLNQKFYRSSEWKNLRRQIFIRDNGCDLGIEGYDILDPKSVIIHHINPLTVDDFVSDSDLLLNPNNLITVSKWTHNLIHFGDLEQIPIAYSRSPHDTCPWKNVR